MWSQEQLEIRALAREFAQGEIRPRAAEWDARRELDGEVFEKLAELGFMGMRAPEEYGGLELDTSTYLLALEELAWGDASVALTVAIHNGPLTSLLLEHGSEEQKKTWLPPLAAGAIIGAFALSEPEAGSDAGGLDTRAERHGDGWVLTGTKRWVTNGDRAGLVVVFAVTGVESEDGKGLGAFLVDRGSEGYRVGEAERTMGLSASETVEVHLDGVRVGPEGVLDDPGQGFRYAMEALDMGRAGIAAQSIGIAQAALEHAAGYAVERSQFGHAIADFGAIQAKLAEMVTRVEAARALTHQVAADLDPRRNGGTPGCGSPGPAMAKLAASETAMWVTNQAVQIFGGYGYMRDYPVEKLMRDAKGTEIYEGTSEILRLVVARAAIREARERSG